AFSVMGLISFVAVLGGFVLPDTPKESPTPEIITTVPVSHDVVPASLTSMPAPKVSTDAEISALRAKKAEEQRKESAEYERQQQAERKRAEQEYLKQANTVVVTPRGKKYHYDTCRTLKGSYREMTIAQARRKGYAPCKVCDPPEQTVTLENSGGIYWGDNVYTRGKQVLDVD
ncbi:MAG: hypothetical protein II877_05730, partial [Synergistaceae bacterium]|nr:hypothetical protein [Synergistaceae bacterium]